MLVITRRIGEKIVIGGGVTVTFLGFKGNQARIGFDAPPNVSVLREEVFSKIKDSEEPGDFDLVQGGGLSSHDFDDEDGENDLLPQAFTPPCRHPGISERDSGIFLFQELGAPGNRVRQKERQTDYGQGLQRKVSILGTRERIRRRTGWCIREDSNL